MRVNTDELLRQATQFHSVIGVAAEARETVLRVARALAREESLEGLTPHLNGIAQRIGDEARDLARLQTALEQIAEAYTATENRVLDRAENNTAVYPIFRPGLIPMPRLPRIQLPAESAEPWDIIDWTHWDG